VQAKIDFNDFISTILLRLKKLTLTVLGLWQISGPYMTDLKKNPAKKFGYSQEKCLVSFGAL